MRKFSIYAMTAAATLTMTGAMPFSSMAAQNTCRTGRGNVIVIGGSGPLSGCTNELPDSLFGCQFLPGGSLGCLVSGKLPSSGNSGNNSGSDNTGGGNGSVIEDSAAAEIVSLVNQERARAGLAPLTLNAAASKAARTRANEIQTSFSHTRPDGKSYSTALTEAGVSYRASGENIAYGQKTAAQVMSGWMNSSGHRANILNASFTEIGVGHVKDASGTDYWVQLFIK